MHSESLDMNIYLRSWIIFTPIIVLLLLFCYFYIIPKLVCLCERDRVIREHRIIYDYRVNPENEPRTVPPPTTYRRQTNTSLTATMQRELVGKYKAFTIYPLITPPEPPRLKPVRPAPRVPPIILGTLQSSQPMENNRHGITNGECSSYDSVNLPASSSNKRFASLSANHNGSLVPPSAVKPEPEPVMNGNRVQVIKERFETNGVPSVEYNSKSNRVSFKQTYV